MESSIYTSNNSNSFNITNDLIVIDTSDNRIGVNTIDPSYSIDVRNLSDVSGIIYTEYLKTGAIISNLTPCLDVCYNLGSQDNKWNKIHTNYLDVSRINFKNQSNENRYFIGLSNNHLVIKDISNDFSVLEADNNTQQVTIPGLARTSDVYSKDYIDNSLNLKANTSDIPSDFYSTSHIDASFNHVTQRLDTIDTSINNIVIPYDFYSTSDIDASFNNVSSRLDTIDTSVNSIVIPSDFYSTSHIDTSFNSVETRLDTLDTIINNIGGGGFDATATPIIIGNNINVGPTFLYSFPGPYTQKQTITVSSPLPSSQFSIECKFSGTQANLFLVGWTVGTVNKEQVSLIVGPQYIALNFIGSGAGLELYPSPDSIANGTTRHILATHDGTTTKIYIDNSLVIQGGSLPPEFNNKTTTELLIGSGPPPHYSGIGMEIKNDTVISDVKIYDTVITPANLVIDDNFIAFNTTNEDINIDASGFYVNPIRNVPDMSYQLFYDVSRNEIVYAEGGGGGGGGFDATATQIALGYNAGLTNQDVSAIAIGNQSGMTSQSYSSIAIGNQSGMTSQQYQSIAIGYQSGMTSQQRQSIAIGYLSGTTSQSNSSIAIGNQAGNNSQEKHCIAIGSSGGNSGQKEQAIAIGWNAGKTNQNTTAIAIGSSAGSSNQGIGSIGIGVFAGQTQGNKCVAIGSSAGTTSNSFSVAIGNLAAQGNQGEGAIAIGYKSSQQNQGSRGVSIGYNSTSSGDNSVAIGNGAGFAGEGNYSIAIGNRAGQNDLCNNSIILNADFNQLNSDASGFYVNPIRNVEGIQNQLFYDVSRNEIVYAEGGVGCIFMNIPARDDASNILTRPNDSGSPGYFTDFDVNFGANTNTSLFSYSGNTVTCIQAGLYELTYNAPHYNPSKNNDVRISLEVAFIVNNSSLGISKTQSYIRSLNDIWRGRCSCSVMKELTANTSVTCGWRRLDNNDSNLCYAMDGQFCIRRH